MDEQVKNVNPAGVGLLQKALHILDLFQQDAPYWTQADISRAAGLTRSTASRLVRFLCEKGYLHEMGPRGRYSLGPAALDLGRRATAQLDLRAVFQPVLEDLSRRTGETVLAAATTPTGNAVACVGQVESTREGLRVFETIGAVFPLHAGAVSKAVLAFLPEDEQERHIVRGLEPKTPFTITDPAGLRTDLGRTRERGYSVSRQETYVGVNGVGAPVFWGDGRPAGSIAIACPIHRADDAAIAQFGALVVEAAAQVTAALGGGTKAGIAAAGAPARGTVESAPGARRTVTSAPGGRGAARTRAASKTKETT